ncbi:MAG: PHB depolymerase family esterase [Thermodesulfobacteriota bacterium]|nr:PHB depolymerase family esterase [Thermodesulfobacteriota bacterium]
MNQKCRLIIPVLIGVLALCGCAETYSTVRMGASSRNSYLGNHIFSISADGLERRYVIHVPQGYNSGKKMPVVIMFHGGGGTARAAMRKTGWAEKADKEGFLAVFPEGTAPDSARPGRFRDNPQTWNDGSKRFSVGAVRRDVADVAFVTQLIDDLKARFSVDGRRIYTTGFSNGASMSFRLAHELPWVIAAIAPVAGADWIDHQMSARPVPVLYITGTADPLNPIDGGEVRIGLKSHGRKPAINDMMANWVKLHHCKEEPHVVYNNYGSRGMAYRNPNGTDAVILYTLDGHGHHWPGGKSFLPEWIAGENTSKLNATDVIWEFFESHSLPAVDETAKKLADAPENSGKIHKVAEYPSYSTALKNWKSINDIADWIRQYFSYDFNRALDLSETNRGDTKKVGVYSPAELYLKKKGVCIDLARFGVETLRKIFPELHAKYIMIEFKPIVISGKTIRKHWIASYQKEGKYYYFADSKRPGYISGLFNCKEKFIHQYERYRGRKIVSFKQLDDFKKKRRLKKQYHPQKCGTRS